jgi:hypothetical protein
VAGSDARWYAIRTRSRHEKVAARELDARGITVFLPLLTSVRQWSDRRTEVELPLFPGYAFVRVAYFSADRVRVLQASGVVNFVGGDQNGDCRQSSRPGSSLPQSWSARTRSQRIAERSRGDAGSGEWLTKSCHLRRADSALALYQSRRV